MNTILSFYVEMNGWKYRSFNSLIFIRILQRIDFVNLEEEFANEKAINCWFDSGFMFHSGFCSLQEFQQNGIVYRNESSKL